MIHFAASLLASDFKVNIKENGFKKHYFSMEYV